MSNNTRCEAIIVATPVGSLKRHLPFLIFPCVLEQDEVPRLQVLLDGKWIDVPPRLGAFICNIGNVLQRRWAYPKHYFAIDIGHLQFLVSLAALFVLSYGELISDKPTER